MKKKHRKQRFYSLNLFALIILFISNLGCDSSIEPVEPAVVKYTISGGFGGGIPTKLVVDQSGVASLESENPVLKLQLSRKEYNSLLQSFVGFNDFPDSEMIRCMDSFIYTVEYQKEQYSKTVRIDDCALDDSTDLKISKLRAIIGKLSSIAQKVRDNQTS